MGEYYYCNGSDSYYKQIFYLSPDKPISNRWLNIDEKSGNNLYCWIPGGGLPDKRIKIRCEKIIKLIEASDIVIRQMGVELLYENIIHIQRTRTI